jgi:hypothetical protein
LLPAFLEDWSAGQSVPHRTRHAATRDRRRPHRRIARQGVVKARAGDGVRKGFLDARCQPQLLGNAGLAPLRAAIVEAGGAPIEPNHRLRREDLRHIPEPRGLR